MKDPINPPDKIIRFYKDQKVIYISSVKNMHQLKKIYGHDNCDYCQSFEEEMVNFDPGKLIYYKNKK